MFCPVLAEGEVYPVIEDIFHDELFGFDTGPFAILSQVARLRLFLYFSLLLEPLPFEYPYSLIER